MLIRDPIKRTGAVSHRASRSDPQAIAFFIVIINREGIKLSRNAHADRVTATSCEILFQFDRARARARASEREREISRGPSRALKATAVLCRERQLAQGASRCAPTIVPRSRRTLLLWRVTPAYRSYLPVSPDIIYSLSLDDAYFRSARRCQNGTSERHGHDVGRDPSTTSRSARRVLAIFLPIPRSWDT